MTRWIIFLLAALALAFTPFSCQRASLRVGSKKFTESVILGEMLAHLARDAGENTVHYREMGGTRLLFQALLNGDIDVYPEYTGTIGQEILAGSKVDNAAAMRELLRRQGVLMSQPLGFNNTYAIGMKRETARRLNIRKISDLARHPELRFGFSNEFMDRGDGWPSLRVRYGLPQTSVRGLDHDLAYRQLDLGATDAIDVYTTDAKIREYDLAVLEDDLGYFPRYDAVLLYRAGLREGAPEALAAFARLEGLISESDMLRMNARAEGRGGESQIAADFLAKKLNLKLTVAEETVASRVWKHTLEHLDLVRKSLIPAILFAIPLGVLAAKRRKFGQVLLGLVGVVQTVPALALLVMLMTPVALLGMSSIGLGSITAVLALFLYSLLPIVRNTYTGLHDIPNQYRESAVALGLPPSARLFRVELPLASRSILAGVKTAAVLNIGFATLGALIGAGGYGQPIVTGIRLNNTALIMQGAIPAALLALVAQGAFELAERFVVPKGLRLKAEA